MKMIEVKKMTPLTIALIAFISGGALTGGVIVSVSKNRAEAQEEQQDIEKIIQSLETEFEKAQAAAITNLTEPDLLKVPCSSEFINGIVDSDGKVIQQGQGDLLCREMFCRMNRQNGEGATESDCSAISEASISILMNDTCMPYWTDNAGADQNSQYLRCIDIFEDGK